MPLLCIPLFIRSFDDDTTPVLYGYLYATILVIGPGIYSIIHNFTNFFLQREGMRIRIALCSLIYRKVRYKVLVHFFKHTNSKIMFLLLNCIVFDVEPEGVV